MDNCKTMVRTFDHKTIWNDVRNMTVEEAIAVLSKYAYSDGKDWSARPHMVKACQMAIEALLYAREKKEDKRCDE